MLLRISLKRFYSMGVNRRPRSCRVCSSSNHLTPHMHINNSRLPFTWALWRPKDGSGWKESRCRGTCRSIGCTIIVLLSTMRLSEPVLKWWWLQTAASNTESFLLTWDNFKPSLQSYLFSSSTPQMVFCLCDVSGSSWSVNTTFQSYSQSPMSKILNLWITNGGGKPLLLITHWFNNNIFVEPVWCETTSTWNRVMFAR